MGKRRSFSAELKTKLVFELLREEKTLGEIAQEHGISPNQRGLGIIRYIGHSAGFGGSKEGYHPIW